VNLGHPEVGRVAEPGLRSQHLGALAALAAQLVLERLTGGGSGAASALDLPGDAVEAAPAAARHPLPALGRDTDLAVLAEGEGRSCHGSASAESFRRVSGGIDLRRH
jgi:hypothetical protein